MTEESKGIATSEELVKMQYKMDFTQLARAIVQDIDQKSGSNIMFSTFPKDRVITALQQPQKNEKDRKSVV